MKLSDWREVTGYMLFCCLVFNMGNILFGYDTFSFGSLQTLPSFLSKFGTPAGDGTYELTTQRKSVMTSVMFGGKIIGCAMFEPMVERLGYKKSTYVLAVIQIVAIIIELTAQEWIQFTFGRVVAYMASGLVEPIVPTYLAELSPAPLRGFFSGNVGVVMRIGSVWGVGMNRAYVSDTTQKGWMVPTAMMALPGVLLLVGVPFCIESPRWLITKGRKDEAIKELNRIRPKRDSETGRTAAEADAWEVAIEEARTQTQGRWIDLFSAKYALRTFIVTFLFWFQQTGGQQFTNSYAPTLFSQIGLSSKSALNYTIVMAVVGVITCAMSVSLSDIVGRRPLCYIGAVLAVVWCAVIAEVGSEADIATNTTKSNAVVASVILLFGSTYFGASSQCWIIGSEIGGTQMRKKVMGYAIIIDVLAAFAVAFCTPYLQDGPTIQLGARVAYVYLGLAALASIFFFFMIPELKGRSLEEVDELFERKLWAWQFEDAKTYGIGARIAAMEGAGSESVDYNDAGELSSEGDTSADGTKKDDSTAV